MTCTTAPTARSSAVMSRVRSTSAATLPTSSTRSASPFPATDPLPHLVSGRTDARGTRASESDACRVRPRPYRVRSGPNSPRVGRGRPHTVAGGRPRGRRTHSARRRQLAQDDGKDLTRAREMRVRHRAHVLQHVLLRGRTHARNQLLIQTIDELALRFDFRADVRDVEIHTGQAVAAGMRGPNGRLQLARRGRYLVADAFGARHAVEDADHGTV